MIRALVVAGAVAALVVVLAPVGGAEPQAASRVIDRTFVCGVKLRAGERRVEPYANSAFRDASPRWEWLPYADVGGREIIAFAGIAAGSPPPTMDQKTPTTRWVVVDARPCNPAEAKVALSARGSSGGVASQLRGSDECECRAPSRILVRLYAEFASPVSVRVQPLYAARYYTTTATTPAKRASAAVTTTAGQPLAYATVSERGRATLFVAKGCTPK